MTCPSCNGIGLIFAAIRSISVKCETCDGTGKIDDKKLLWINQGSWLRNYRLKTLKLGLRAASKKYHIDASNLSKMERGVIKPHFIYREENET